MSSELKDFPLTLKLSCQAEHLAGAIYYCASSVYGGSGRMWEALPSDVKRPYRAQALSVLKALKPEPASVLSLVSK